MCQKLPINICKRMLLMRHGIAESPVVSGSDFNRELTEEGKNKINDLKKDFQILGQWLPQKVYCSDAKRAVDSLETLKESLNIDPVVEYCSHFYTHGTREVIDTIVCTEDEYDIILLVGHNPVWSHMVELFSNKYLHLNPGNIVLLEKKVDSWGNCFSESGWNFHKII